MTNSHIDNLIDELVREPHKDVMIGLGPTSGLVCKVCKKDLSIQVKPSGKAYVVKNCQCETTIRRLRKPSLIENATRFFQTQMNS